MMNETNSHWLYLYQCAITEAQDLHGPDFNNTQAYLSRKSNSVDDVWPDDLKFLSADTTVHQQCPLVLNNSIDCGNTKEYWH